MQFSETNMGVKSKMNDCINSIWFLNNPKLHGKEWCNGKSHGLRHVRTVSTVCRSKTLCDHGWCFFLSPNKMIVAAQALPFGEHTIRT